MVFQKSSIVDVYGLKVCLNFVRLTSNYGVIFESLSKELLVFRSTMLTFFSGY